MIEGVELLKLPEKKDNRGSLCFCEAGIKGHIPFKIKRAFWIFRTPKGAVRGRHAHRRSQQAHVCLHGSVKIQLDNGKEKQGVVLNRPNRVLILGPMIWHSFCLEEGSLLFVFTSNWYSEKDYVRDYEEFLSLVRTPK